MVNRPACCAWHAAPADSAPTTSSSGPRSVDARCDKVGSPLTAVAAVRRRLAEHEEQPLRVGACRGLSVAFAATALLALADQRELHSESHEHEACQPI